MVRLSMNELTTLRWSFDEDVHQYVAAGYDGISVWRQKLADFGEQRGAELLRDSDIQVASLTWAGGFTGSDGRTHAEAIRDGIDAIKLAVEINSPSLVVYTGSRSGHTDNHARRLFITAVSELTALAESSGVDLILEPMHPLCCHDWTFLTDIERAIEILDEVDSPRLRLVLDLYHVLESDDELERLAELTPRTALIQLGDARVPPEREPNRCLLGQGRRPLGAAISRFIDAGYEGFFDVELMGEDVEHFDYEYVIRHSRRAFDAMLGGNANPPLNEPE